MELGEKLFRLNLDIDNWLETSKEITQTIESKYSPRNEFNTWRNSQEGKEWKKKQYAKQNGCCALCGISFSLKGAHIDHIKPISTHPHLALQTNNLQLTHGECNSKKAH